MVAESDLDDGKKAGAKKKGQKELSTMPSSGDMVKK